ncbi:3'-5'-exoribonuclease, partial [Claviceps africana]
MSDRRRVNGPAGATQPPFYHENAPSTPFCDRDPGLTRPIYLKTGVTPSASGSAYLEIEERRDSTGFGLKLICTVYGPRSLPRSAPFSPHVVISTHVKYAPFATQKRRGYSRDSGERDLSLHLETALRGAIIADRWPKSGVDVIVTVVEGDTDRRTTIDDGIDNWYTMTVLSGCITVASAAIADAGIDCVDAVTGGVAALVMAKGEKTEPLVFIDPVLADPDTVVAA